MLCVLDMLFVCYIMKKVCLKEMLKPFQNFDLDNNAKRQTIIIL